jgi:hypothetical protein
MRAITRTWTEQLVLAVERRFPNWRLASGRDPPLYVPDLCLAVVVDRRPLGQLLPLGRMNLAEVNIPVAVLIWLMIVPMLLEVDFGALHQVAEKRRGIAVTVGMGSPLYE